MMQLALPPVGWGGLAFGAIVPLWWVCQTRCSLGSAALAGLWWGLGFYGSSLVWVWDLHPLMWIGIDPLPSWLISRAIWLFLSLWGACLSSLWAVLMARYICGHRWWWELLAGVTLWCSLEALWSYSPLWWISVSLSQSPHGFVHLSRLAGPTTLTAVVLAVNGLITLALRHNHRYLGYGVVVLVAALLLNGGLAATVAADQGPGLRVGIIQGNIPTREKLTPEGIRRAWIDYTRGYRELVAAGAEAVLTPEGALPILWQPGQVNLLTSSIQQAGVPLWLGTFMSVPDGHHQVLLTLDERGQIYSRYNKVNLVLLGEYIPDWLSGVVQRLSTLQSRLIPGEPDQVFRTPWGNAVVLICFESAFSHRSRGQVYSGGEFILSVANNDPYRRQLMAQHHGHDVLRAVEGDRWLVRATNTGLSAVIDPKGTTRWLSEPDRFITHTATIYRRQHLTPYSRFGDWLLPLLGVATIASGYSAAFRRRGWR
ncbi:apolipoprotein N-acyltransferase [Thermosynechococcaceae cyanobacterium Okahandja]